jgi:hypothetical protein
MPELLDKERHMSPHPFDPSTSNPGLNILTFIQNAWPIFSVFLIVFLSVGLAVAWLRKSKSPVTESPNQPRQNFSNLYNRIYNYQNDSPHKSSASAAQSHNNASTDSTYHHAIKLIQKGIDTKTLVEYCNLTEGEAELLQVVYGNRRT